MLTTLFILVSLFASFIWVDYLRRIDVYEREHWLPLAFVFFGGACSVVLIHEINENFLNNLNFHVNGDLLNDYLYCFAIIGIPEEFVKYLPLLIVLLFFPRLITEPIDVIIYSSASAVGFACVENVMYMNSYGADVLISRSILCIISHMMFASIAAYGIVLFRYKKSQFKYILPLFYFILAALAHGFYDLWLLNDRMPFNFLFSLIFYMLLVSIYSTIINNCLNNSPEFSNKKAVNSTKIQKRLALYYAILVVMIIIVAQIEEPGEKHAIRMIYPLRF